MEEEGRKDLESLVVWELGPWLFVSGDGMAMVACSGQVCWYTLVSPDCVPVPQQVGPGVGTLIPAFSDHAMI